VSAKSLNKSITQASLSTHLHIRLFDQIENLLYAEAPPFCITRFDLPPDSEWKHMENAVSPKGIIVRLVDRPNNSPQLTITQLIEVSFPGARQIGREHEFIGLHQI
jgi:hypothetical protein